MKTFIKKNIRFIIIVVICITCSVLTTFATTTLFNSSEVYYNNTTSGIQADKVQGAIDELYACASNYAAYNQRLTAVESKFQGDLLWSTTGDIGATTINIPNLYNYDEIRIIWNDASSGDSRITYAIPILGTSIILQGVDIDGSKDYAHAFNIRARIGTFVTNGIQWSNGQMIYNGTVYKDWASRATPKKIYGIKY